MEPELQARPRAVLLTRPAGEADPLAGLLRGRGLDVVAVQTVALEPVAPGGALDAAVEDLAGFDWVLATSAAAVAALADAAER
ncbi:MAG TPA: uroporphyrinogen-III synthase, partial [Candidatus Limnocylindrales bacterium]